VGARSVLERAMRTLNGADSSFPDLDLDRLHAELELWRRYLDDSEGADEKKSDGREVRRHTAPVLPKLVLRARSPLDQGCALIAPARILFL
jgi:hypothetical protein